MLHSRNVSDVFYPRDVTQLEHGEAETLADALFALRLAQYKRWIAAGMTQDRAIGKTARAVVRHRAIAHGARPA